MITVVTGANSGIGRAAALHLAAAGHTVYGGMRDLDRGDKLAALASDAGVEVRPLELDVADDASVDRAFTSVLEADGRVDVLVNNAGIGMNAVVEEIDIDAAKEVFDVNWFGIVRCTQAVLPGMRERRAGTIVNVSSVAGRVAALAQAVYASSEWAVECLSEAIADETDRLRYVCAYGGEELADGRAGLSDADWIGLGRADDDEDYARRFRDAFGLEIPAGWSVP